MKLTKTIRRLVLVASLALPAVAGCKDKGATTTPKTESAEAGKEAAPYDQQPSKAGPGWRWEGKRSSCFYLVGKTCFDKRKDACQAAECSAQTCRATPGVPSRVSCKQ